MVFGVVNGDGSWKRQRDGLSPTRLTVAVDTDVESVFVDIGKLRGQ